MAAACSGCLICGASRSRPHPSCSRAWPGRSHGRRGGGEVRPDGRAVVPVSGGRARLARGRRSAAGGSLGCRCPARAAACRPPVHVRHLGAAERRQGLSGLRRRRPSRESRSWGSHPSRAPAPRHSAPLSLSDRTFAPNQRRSLPLLVHLRAAKQPEGGTEPGSGFASPSRRPAAEVHREPRGGAVARHSRLSLRRLGPSAVRPHGRPLEVHEMRAGAASSWTGSSG